MELLEKIINWAEKKAGISVLILSGSLAAKGKKDSLSDYDIAVYGNDFDFIDNDDWIKDIDDYLVCIHDQFELFHRQIPTRLTILNEGTKIDFSFHPLALLDKLVNQEKLPDAYNIGYRILLDKENLAEKMPPPSFHGFRISKPSANDFELNYKEFWFETYHVAKYLSREDLWTANLRASAAKKWLLQMIEWNHAAKMKWNFSPKNDGKNMKSWTDKKIWKDLSDCFGRFDKKDGWKALEKTTKLYRKIAIKTAAHLHYKYGQKLDDGIIDFMKQLK